MTIVIPDPATYDLPFKDRLDWLHDSTVGRWWRGTNVLWTYPPQGQWIGVDEQQVPERVRALKDLP